MQELDQSRGQECPTRSKILWGGSDNVLGYRTTFYLPAKVSESPGLQWKTLSYFESMISQNAEGKKNRGFDFRKFMSELCWVLILAPLADL